MSADTSYLLIARMGGASSTRRQRRLASEAAIERAVTRWRREGYTSWWIFGPAAAGQPRPLVREWTDVGAARRSGPAPTEPDPRHATREDVDDVPELDE